MKNKENSLAVLRPDLAREWHPWRNGNLKPEDVTCGSNRKVWWYLPYEDEKTGKFFEFEWETTIVNRVQGKGCPYLSNQKIWLGFNDLASVYPDIAAQWNYTKNGDLKPTDVTYGSAKKVWWLLNYNDAKTKKEFVFEWEAPILSRVNGVGCPYLSNKKICIGFNDLATTHPDLEKEWHPIKNGNLKPTDFTAGSAKEIWWYLPYKDAKTDKTFNFEWKEAIYNRVYGLGCPYLSNQKVWKGFNDLATTHPHLAKEWHPTKNENLRPMDVTAGSGKKVWWLLPYVDPKTGKTFNFEWCSNIKTRAEGLGCPYLSNQKNWKGFNDLATTHPHLALEWHPTKNGNLKPCDVIAGSDTQKVWWYLKYNNPKTGKSYELEWQSTPYHRAFRDQSCPCLAKSHLETFVHDLFKSMKMKYIIEKTFPKCLSLMGNRCKYDFYLSDESFLIECDGIQHFENIKFFGDDEGFDRRVNHDNIKNEFAFSNNIPLLRIPYIYDTVKDKEKIRTLVLKFIETQMIPQEIIDFYSQFEFSKYAEYAKNYNKNIQETVS